MPEKCLKPETIQGIQEDRLPLLISACAEARAELSREKEFNAGLVAAIPFVFVSFDVRGRVTVVNDLLLKMIGRGRSSAAVTDFRDFIPRADQPAFLSAFNRLKRQPGSFTLTTGIISPGGRREITWFASGFSHRGEKSYYFVGEDITARLAAESRLGESEDRYRILFENSPNPILVLDGKGCCLDANRAALSFFECGMENLAGRLLREYAVPGWEELVDAAGLRACKSGEMVEAEFLVNGKIKILNISFSPVTINGKLAFVGDGKDVTDSREQERERELLITALEVVNQSNDVRSLLRGITECLRERLGFDSVGIRLRDGMDFPYYETSGSSNGFVLKERFFCALDTAGLPLREASGNSLLECMCGNVLRGRFDSDKPFFSRNGSFWTNSTTSLLASATEADRRAWTRNRCNGQGCETVALIPLKLGTVPVGLIQLNDRRKGRLSPGMLICLEQLAVNLSTALAGHMLKEKIERSEELYRALADNFPNGGVTIFDRETRCLLAGGMGLADIGHTKQSMEGRKLAELLPERVANEIEDHLRQALSGNDQVFEIRYDDDHLYEIRMVLLKAAEDVPERVLLVCQDITDRIRAEKALKERESFFRSITSLSTIGFYMSDLSGRRLYVNEYWCEMAGIPAGRALGMGWLECVHPEDRKAVEEAWSKMTASSAESWGIEFRFLTPAGKSIWVYSRTRALKGQDGSLTGYIGAVIDITEHKNIEQALKESEGRYRLMFETAASLILVLDPSGVILDCNQRIQRIYGQGKEAVVGRSLKEFIDPGSVSAAFKAIEMLLSGVPTVQVELCLKRKDGRSIEVSVNASLMQRGDGSACVICVIDDITEKKQYLRALEESRKGIELSLREKEVLLKELNHRVKNNLQVVSSLMNLQSRCAGENVKNILKECQGRIRSIVLVHENLYMASNLANVDFSDYVSNLCSNLFRSFGADAENIRLELKVQPGVPLGIDLAIPCGLMINELVTNSLKYAFPRKKGRVTVAFSSVPGGFSLQVKDNGRGFPRDFDYSSPPSLGMQLVLTLVEQLNGNIRIGNDGGAFISVTFPGPLAVSGTDRP